MGVERGSAFLTDTLGAAPMSQLGPLRVVSLVDAPSLIAARLTPSPVFWGRVGVGVERGSARCLFVAALPRPNVSVMSSPLVPRDRARRLRREQTDAERRLMAGSTNISAHGTRHAHNGSPRTGFTCCVFLIAKL